MAPSKARNPTSWDEYDGRASLSGSLTSSAVAEEEALIDDDNDNGGQAIPSRQTERRRSSVTNRLAAVADIGGLNSFRSFARSWQRAASFTEVIPRRQSFVLASDQPYTSNPDSDYIQYSRSHVDSQPPPLESGLLRLHLEASGRTHISTPPLGRAAGEVGSSRGPFGASDVDDFRARESKALDVEIASGAPTAASPSSHSSIFAVPPHLATPTIIDSYGSLPGSNYGTMTGGSIRRRPSFGRRTERGQAGDEDESGREYEVGEDDDAALGEEQPILIREIKKGDKVTLTVEGQSTLPQSVFNSINALIGVGLLSLPLAIKMSGWVIGLSLLTLTAAVTAHTGKLLGRCMEFDPTIITYSDLAYISFGTRARVIVSVLFTLELLAACVALIILFADSLDLLLPGVATVNAWKCVCAVLVLVLNALPLRWLSYTSVVGIFSTFCIVCIVVIDGLVKDHSPGSLWEPAAIHLLPSNWRSVPLAYGLLASPWGAHSVFPSIYRDMRHPHKWSRGVKVTFSFSYAIDTSLAIIGILMFGDGISDAITSNILKTAGYPKTLTILMCIFVAIIPLTKIPLNARPLITTADVVCGLQYNPHHRHIGNDQRPSIKIASFMAVVRVGVVLVLLLISMLFPAFDSVCAFLGAALCSLISVLLPISFYLKLYWGGIPTSERIALGLLFALFSIFGLVGTVWTFLPKRLIDA